MNTKQLTNDALEAFWAVVVKQFPQATTGDLSPLTTFQLEQASEAAIKEWIRCNVTTEDRYIPPG